MNLRTLSFVLLWMWQLLAAQENFALPEFVNFEGRVRPLNSLENAVANALCEKQKCAGLKPQTLLQKIVDGSADSLNVFRVNRSMTVEILHLDPARREFKRSDFEESRSLLKQYAERDDSHPQTHELSRLDYALDLFDSLQVQGFCWRISVPRQELSSTSLRQLLAERAYLNWNLPFCVWIFVCMAFGLSLLALWKSWAWKAALVMQSIVSLGCAGIFLWRGIVENRVPLTTLYEMLLALVLGVSIFAVAVSAKGRVKPLLTCGSGICLALFLVMRSALAGDPFGAVAMILNSSFWLSMHVFTIAVGFCGLILASLLAHVMLAKRAFGGEVSVNLQKLLFGTLGVGFAVSTLGTLFGGFWAEVAWGRFWGWDPKENGALLVLIWVLMVIHLKAQNFVKPKTLEVLSSLLLIVIAFCLFGVNLLGVGLHSYGFSANLLVAFSAFVLGDVWVVCFLSFWKRNKRRK